ncbi:MAG TPA: hypothetical protein VGK72_04065 [Chthoniobacterales bacterium]
MKFKLLIFAAVTLALCASTRSQPTLTGILQGHLTIVSPSEVDLEGGRPAEWAAVFFARFPLLVRDRDGKIVARLLADQTGNFKLPLPPGNYLLDAEGRKRGHLRAKPEPFAIEVDRTTRVEMHVDTGVR